MEATREIRWFLPYPLPGVEQWFAAKGIPLDTRESRTDFYFRSDCSAELGLKHREGNIEPKKRLSRSQPTALGQAARGFFESWIKYSFSTDNNYSQLFSEDQHWIRVSKQRTTLIVTSSGSSYEFHLPGDDVNSGCQVEYSRVVLAGITWYTYCLEWFGGAEISMDDLSDEILGEHTLSAENSMGYPEFLMESL